MRGRILSLCVLLAVSAAAGLSASAEESWHVVGSGSTFSPEADEVDRAVERGLRFIVSQQQPKGSFSGHHGDTSALAALAGMAFLSKGHLPSSETYGPTIRKCLDYVLSTADMSENAKFRGYMGGPGNGRMYAHAIATLFLSELSGMVDDARQARIDAVLPHAVKVILDAQDQRKNNPAHLGGWRYQPHSDDSDLSCSGWCLMALRSARLNGVRLPGDAIEKAVGYVKRTQRKSDGCFSYQWDQGQHAETLTGAGILCLELCGRHLDPDARRAAQFVAQTYRKKLTGHGNIHYGLYYTAQGLFQLGGDLWKEFAGWMYETYLARQQDDGSWHGNGEESNPVYATAMTALAFTVPYRMLPIYQRDETVDADEEGKETK